MKRKSLTYITILLLTSLACNLTGVINPSLPTNTPENQTPSHLTPIPPTPTAIATPQPGERISTGDKAFWFGDWDKAIFEYSLAYDLNDDSNIKSASLLGLGKSHYANGEYTKALESLSLLITNYPNSNDRANAFFYLGHTFEALGSYLDAASAYQEYLNLRPGIIDFYALEFKGDVLLSAGDYSNTIVAYQQSLQAPHVGDALEINIKIGNTYALMEDYNTVLVIYQDVFNRTTNDFTKAEMLFYMGQANIALGNIDQAYAFYQQTVNNYPLSYFSYLALVELVEADIPVNELNRGLVDYYAGQYSVAIAAFDRYLQNNPINHVDTAHFYKGLAYQNLGNYQTAISIWEEMIEDHPNDSHWADGFDEISFTQWFYLNQYEKAIQTLENFIKLAPQHPQAPELLYFAARTAERYGNLLKAAQLWEKLGIQYSTSNYGYDGLFQAGISYYRLRDYSQAIESFQSALGISKNREHQAAAYFWMGKSFAAQNKPQEAQGAWQQAVTSDPTGYYSERASDILNGAPGFRPPPNYQFSFDKEAEQTHAEDWIRATFNIPLEESLNSPGPLQNDPRFIRGTELWHLGLYNQARIEFESLRTDLTSDPANSYRLANHLIDLGLYRSGIIAARTVLDLAGLDDASTLNAPPYFNYLRFGAYFQEILLPAAEAYNFHPLFLYSVLRQESLFEGFVTSSAGARGLMQIMPPTGQNIFSQNGWPLNYSEEDLYRPIINITYGADYLASQRNYFQNDLYASLAAYNGGAGNAANWLLLSNGDPDLFVEVIRFSETRRYIRSIYEIYSIYINLYARP